MDHKKISGCGYVSCLNRHAGIDIIENAEGRHFVQFEGVRSRSVEDAFAVDGQGELLFWELVYEIEDVLTNVYLRKSA